MKIISYVILLALAGLIIGYLLFGRVDGIYVDPGQIIYAPDFAGERGSLVPYDLEKIRSRIYLAGLIGGLAGLAVGFIRQGKKRPSFF